ncbi:MAG: peptidase, S24 family protein [Desulfovibrio sp.]|nr:peptidase, S24 family protein [Desulfovibrio sp.]
MTSGDTMREFFLAQIGKGRRFPTQVEMARFLGLKATTATTLYGFLKGARTQYAYVLEWFEKLGGQISLPGEELNGFVFVPRVEAVAGAGESWETSAEPAGMYAFRESFMRIIGINPRHAIMMYVRGDSMEPLINDHDTILVDTRDNEPRDGFIYLIGFGETAMVKRLQRTPRGWNLCSENKNYPPIPVEGQEVMQVHGRVRWFGRVVK